MSSTMSIALCLIALALAAIATTTIASTTHRVGGEEGWKVPKDGPLLYELWAVNKTFVVGDKLEFVWMGTHNVAEVTKDDFKNCTEGNAKLHKVSPAIIALDTPGTKYFMCAVIPHCAFMQRLSINVQPEVVIPPPAPAPSSAPSSSLANALYAAAMLTIGSMLFTCL